MISVMPVLLSLTTGLVGRVNGNPAKKSPEDPVTFCSHIKDTLQFFT